MSEQTKVNQLLAILDLSEDQQKIYLAKYLQPKPWLHLTSNEGNIVCAKCEKVLKIAKYDSTAPDHILSSYHETSDFNKECSIPNVIKESLAELAFRLRNECHDPFGWCAWDRGCWEVWKYHHKQLNNNIIERKHLSLEIRERYCFNWMLFWADPIHWIIAALITKEIVADVDEKFDAHLTEKEGMRENLMNKENANQIRQLLKKAEAVRDGGMLFNDKYTVEAGLAKICGYVQEALTLLLCETCGGSGKVWCEGEGTNHIAGSVNTRGWYSCPDCQPCKRCGGTDGNHRQVNDPEAGNSHMLTKMQCPLDDHKKRTLAYGIAQDDGNGGFGFWEGPNPSLEQMLAINGRDNKTVLWRFNADGTDEIIYKWCCGEWMKVTRE